jgi:DNA polymerase III sliding clamp (beta) subunit (PCNA family)
MIVVNIALLKNILKNATTLCEKKNIVSVFDVIFIIRNDKMVIITEGVSGAGANIMAIENPEQLFCIIKTGFNILSKLIVNISSDHLILWPQDQGVLLIQSHNAQGETAKTKKKVEMNFSIYSHNIYLLDDSYGDDETFNKYKIYWDFLIDNQWTANDKHIIEMASTQKFVNFLKNISYAASTDNDRAFSNIFFQWESNQLMANSSNRIRIAVGKIPTVNGHGGVLKFSCDKKSINSFIKSVQNYLEEPLILRIGENQRIHCLLGNNFVLEMGYHMKRSININEFFNVLESSQTYLCNTEEFKQAIQCGKSFATKFHYSIMINGHVTENIDGSGSDGNTIRFYFQEPNHGNIESFINEGFNNKEPFTVEVNVLYLWDAIMAINTKQLLLMINSQYSYLFLIPYSDNMDIKNIKNLYDSAHLIMCLR